MKKKVSLTFLFLIFSSYAGEMPGKDACLAMKNAGYTTGSVPSEFIDSETTAEDVISHCKKCFDHVFDGSDDSDTPAGGAAAGRRTNESL